MLDGRRTTTIVVALALLLTIGAALIGPGSSAQAADGTVTGTVEIREAGVPVPFEGVTMSLIGTGGGAPVASVDTGADGAYALTAAPGDYTLRAEPPDAAGLAASERSVTIGDGTTSTVDFLFTPLESLVAVSGTVTRAGGVPLPGVRVSFNAAADSDDRIVTTDANGNFAVEVPPRTFNLIVNAGGLPLFPQQFALFADDVLIDTPQVIDVELPGSVVDIEVVDAETGVAIDGALVDGASNNAGGPSILGRPSLVRSSFAGRSATAGQLSIFLPPGSTVLSATATDYESGGTTTAVPTADTVRIELVPEPEPGEVRFTGRLITSDGTPLPGVPINGERGSLGFTAADGTFDVVDDSVPNNGNGFILFDDPFPPLTVPSLPPSWRITGSIPHPDGQTVALGDVTYRTEPVTITVVDPDGVVVPNASFNAGFPTLFRNQQTALGPFSGLASSVYQSNAIVPPGGLTFRLAPTTSTNPVEAYNLRFSPPEGVDSCTFSRYNLIGTTAVIFVDGPENIQVELDTDRNDPFCAGEGPSRVAVEGRLLLGGEPPARSFVGFLLPDGTRVGGTEADANGDFTSEVLEGSYGLDVIRTSPTDVQPELRIDSVEPFFTVAGPGPVDIGTFDVPLQDLAVTVLSPDGRPIPGVAVTTPGVGELERVTFTMNGSEFTGYSRFRRSLTTDADGSAILPLLPSTYDLTFTPEAGFLPFTLEDVTLPVGGTAVQVQLAFPHDPPTATIDLTGPSTAADVFNGDVEVTVTPTAFAGFDVDTVEVAVDDGPFTVYGGPFDVTAEGDRSVTVRVTDTGGVTGPPVTRSFTIESIDPTTSTEPPTTSTEPPTSSTEPPTSSTEPPTSSTEPPTSSTEPPTSSTEPPTSSTEPPTTTAVGTAPTTSTGTTPPTTTPPSGGVGSGSAGADGAGGETLPETGTSVSLWLPALLLTAGLCLQLIVRRRPSPGTTPRRP